MRLFRSLVISEPANTWIDIAKNIKKKLLKKLTTTI